MHANEPGRIFINGINGVTGDYLVSPQTPAEIAGIAKGLSADTFTSEWLSRMAQVLTRAHFEISFDKDPTSIKDVGWAVVFHANEDAVVRKQLLSLVEHRRKQAGKDDIVKELEYREGEGLVTWLARHDVSSGSVVPNKVPYYILLVGGPEKIPFSFGFLLDVEYQVGRIAFDTPEEYAQYVQSVIDYETDTGTTALNSKEIVYFGSRHAFDEATQLSADMLITPLADHALNEEIMPLAEKMGFAKRKLIGREATKEALTGIFSGKVGRTPALMMSATHGMGWPVDDSHQKSSSGALVCQDWPGLGGIGPGHYFAGSDLPNDAKVHGMISFCFACYGAGVPDRDRFFHNRNQQPPQIASKPFFSDLPRKLLTHGNGGSLAFIGHVERAWDCSFGGRSSQIMPFYNALGRIMMGQPVAYAMKTFNEKYAILSADLSRKLEDVGFGAEISDDELANNWLQRNDAEGYIVFGDPAVRLRINDLQ